MPADYQRIHRLLLIITMVRAKPGLTGCELAEHFQVTERTIRDDVGVLRAIGIPCDHDPDVGGYVISRTFFLPPIEFTSEEAFGLLLLLEQIPATRQIPHLLLGQRAILKIRSLLRDNIKEDISSCDGHVQIDLARNETDESKDVYTKVFQAIANKRTLRCRYAAGHSAKDDAEDEIFELRPYVLWYCQRAFYVVGFHCGRNDVRSMRLSRFDYVEETGKPYMIPDEFSMKQYLGNAWRMIRGGKDYRVAVRFAEPYATTVSETRWHPTQQEIHNKDGSITLTFTVSGFKEIKFWILGYGAGAQVVEPKELADEVKKEALAAAALYDTEK